MQLFKTLVLPADDAQTSRDRFTDIIRNHAFILMVVKGTGAGVEQVVELADKMAGGALADGWRRVVWAQDPAAVADLISAIAKQPLIPNLNDGNVSAFALSLADEACDAIMTTELPVTKSRLLLAYKRAES